MLKNKPYSFGQILLGMGAGLFILFGGYVIAAVFTENTAATPLMKCDPAQLARDMSKDMVLSYCGEPTRRAGEVNPEPWYPLQQTGPREEKDMWIYGDVTDKKRNVNLYFTDNKLRSVQIYGSGR